MNRNYIAGFAAGAVIIIILALAAWTLFEIAPRTKWVPPSREARTNEYLALDRWLDGMGIPVRVEGRGNTSMVSQAEEKHIFIQASLFRWTDEAAKFLVNWIEDGGQLFLSLDDDYEETSLLLKEFGITADAGRTDYHYDPASPSYDRNISFKVEDINALTLKDSGGMTRLVQVKRGKGTLTVTGKPRFLLSLYLDEEPNAHLAWAFFAHNMEQASVNPGWLFIRGETKTSGLFGSLWRHGNMAVLLVSVLVLLVIGFWSAIPMFGLIKEDDEKPDKPLRERFLAEGRFLKRYGALEAYRDVYVREIKRRLARKEGLVDDAELIQRVMEIRGKDGNNSPLNDCILNDCIILESIFLGEPFNYRDFPKMIVIFNIILARIKKGIGE